MRGLTMDNKIAIILEDMWNNISADVLDTYDELEAAYLDAGDDHNVEERVMLLMSKELYNFLEDEIFSSTVDEDDDDDGGSGDNAFPRGSSALPNETGANVVNIGDYGV
jgi:hypothetical protein